MESLFCSDYIVCNHKQAEAQTCPGYARTKCSDWTESNRISRFGANQLVRRRENKVKTAVCLRQRNSLELRRIMAFRQTYSSLWSFSSRNREVAASSMSKISMMPSTHWPSSLQIHREKVKGWTTTQRGRQRHGNKKVYSQSNKSPKPLFSWKPMYVCI